MSLPFSTHTGGLGPMRGDVGSPMTPPTRPCRVAIAHQTGTERRFKHVCLTVRGRNWEVPLARARALVAFASLIALSGCCFIKQLFRYAQAIMIQTSHTAIAHNSKAKIEERLARWIQMVHDRVPGNELALTHEFIALMLGARRPGVTEAIHALAKLALIRNPKPGMIIVLDRIGLEKAAGPFYGVPEKEYARLIG